MSSPILDISTAPAEVLHVSLDGKLYELTHPRAMRMGDMVRVEALRRALLSLQILDDAQTLTPEQEATIESTLDQIVRVLLKAPDDVHARLGDAIRLAIVGKYVELKDTPAPPAALAPRVSPARRKGRAR